MTAVGAPRLKIMSAYRWWLAGTLVLGWASAIALISPMFTAGADAHDLPILYAVALMVGGGMGALGLFPLIGDTDARMPAERTRLLWVVLAIGLVARLILLTSTPIMEVDFNRYLWDGGMVVAGFDPYAIAPAEIARLPYDDLRLELSKAAAPIFDRISYAALSTIYPPVAQVAFALAHMIEPWSLTAWRGLIIAADLATFMLIVMLLRAARRNPLWVALYWWSPLVLKELVNSAHMEAVLLPFVLGALVAALRQRPWFSMFLLVGSIGTKLWPLVLAPLLWRWWSVSEGNTANRRYSLGLAFAVLVVVVSWPLLRQFGEAPSGLAAFAGTWSTNSAHMVLLEGLAGPRGARLICGLCVATIALWLAHRPARDDGDLMRKAYLTVSAVVLLSPAQFPWYVLWVLPLACIHGGRAWFVAAALLPLYYAAFYLRAIDRPALHHSLVVWLIWTPVWIALWRDVRRYQRTTGVAT